MAVVGADLKAVWARATCAFTTSGVGVRGDEALVAGRLPYDPLELGFGGGEVAEPNGDAYAASYGDLT